MLDDDRGEFRLFVDPDLETFVQQNDRPFLDSLLEDFVERSKLHPESLFQQVSSLSVGPVVTHRTGTFAADKEYIQTHCSHFQHLAPSKN